MKSKIGIVICGFAGNRQFVSDAYIQAIKQAGGIPLLLPLVKSNTMLCEYTKLCDGFLFCGGDDITPLLFGSEPFFGIGKTDITLDIFQLRLMRAVLETSKPVLAICRGMQILNVALKGTILQDISSSPEDYICHMQNSDARRDISHKVVFQKDSLLHRILGDFAYTNSFHHQAVATLGRGVSATAHTGDGLTEGIEVRQHPFAVGVQWHPECMLETSPPMKHLFHTFVSRT